MVYLDISKEQFLEAYNKYPPNNLIKTAFRYFSLSTSDEDAWVGKTVAGFFIILFVIGLLGTILEMGRVFIGFMTYTFGILLSSFVLSLFAAVFMNNYRIRKIRKKLRISRNEYNSLASKYIV